ncbi:unnamed protein product [Bemisia tabaci]|uniref:mRNA m(6)A methyltransferase n=1 Tax=Bemisia tabaci TaxID=7038 RepID=A0A9P0G2D8_BEMTA|nr:unnamed protein product [Bemisia tabaci]
MSDAWEDIQAIKSKRNSLREKLQKRKKERQDILNQSASSVSADKILSADTLGIIKIGSPIISKSLDEIDGSEISDDSSKCDPTAEQHLLNCLTELALSLPVTSLFLTTTVSKMQPGSILITHTGIVNLLQKFATQKLINVKESTQNGIAVLEVTSVEHSKLQAMVNELSSKNQSDSESEVLNKDSSDETKRKKGSTDPEELEPAPKVLKSNGKVEQTSDSGKIKDKKETETTDIMSLLSMPSAREKEVKKVGEEILDLLNKPTAKERSLAERFRSQGGAQVMEFCPHGTKSECLRVGNEHCKKLHFKKIIQSHTDESLGDCSFLNTCFHMDTCKYVHYEVDGSTTSKDPLLDESLQIVEKKLLVQDKTILYPPQWVQCDLRYLDMTVLGKFAVIMADPPWDIHMELPYGTMSDDEMRQLGIPQLQDDGLLFLWVTGRAMELGRECLMLWGYERVDELIWVKTNQLQRIIRTGRTGHWLNHGKEHCLVGMKGNPMNLNRGLDCDVIVAEVRATSHKPDEIYGIIERLSPGTRKIELFGRPHNVQPNWITLGNQVDGVRLVDPELIQAFKERYPDGNCMVPPKS